MLGRPSARRLDDYFLHHRGLQVKYLVLIKHAAISLLMPLLLDIVEEVLSVD